MRCKERQRSDSGWPAGISCGFILLAVLSAGLAGEATDSAESGLLEQVLAAVQDCMARSPAPWADAWQREYGDTIRQAIAPHPDIGQYAMRLEILSRGFQPYWEGLQKGQDKSLFEVHCAEIRWYLECLMEAGLPGEEESHALRNQYKDLFHYGASSLLTQFPFLDPNAVHRAQADHLAQCYHRIEAPLLPIYLRPFSQTEMDRIKQRWHDLRYARVDLWRQLGGDASISARDPNGRPINTHPHYLLAQRSLAQLQPHIWAIAAPAPGYYRSAVANHIDAQKHRFRSKSQAWTQERRMNAEVLQTEYICFLLAALLETAECVDTSVAIRAQKETASERQDSPAKGGGAHGCE